MTYPYPVRESLVSLGDRLLWGMEQYGVGTELFGSTAYVGFNVGLEPKDAYFYCDGTADDVQINLADAYVVALGGGTVELEQGTFVLAAPIIPTGNHVWFKGQGVATLIDGDGLATAEHCFHITGRDDITISDMSIQTQGGVGNTSHCIFIEDGSDDFHILHVGFPDSDDNGIHIEGTTIVGGHIHDCHVNSIDGNAVFVDMDGGETISYLHISDNDFMAVGDAGVRIEPSSGNNNCTITGNIIISPLGIGILVDDYNDGQIMGNTCNLGGLSGIHVIGSDGVNIADNICSTNERHGIFLTASSDECIIDGNICNDNDDHASGSYDGIKIDNACIDNTVINNTTLRNHGNGIYTVGVGTLINSNLCKENDLHGIQFSGGDTQVNGNLVSDNSQGAAGVSHGIHVLGSGDRSILIGNHIDSPGDSQEDCIQLSNGATQVVIIGNFCQNGMGSGIALSSNNDECYILGNFLFENDDYGVEIAGTCNDTRVLNNNFNGNVTGAVLDGGVDSIFETKQYYVARDDDNIGAIPGKSITNGQTAYVAVHAPTGMQQLMGFNIYVIPNATQGAANWDLETDYGAIGELSGLHGETEAAATYNVTDDTWFAVDAFAAGMFASLVEEDTGGISLTVGTAGHDVTVVMAELYYV